MPSLEDRARKLARQAMADSAMLPTAADRAAHVGATMVALAKEFARKAAWEAVRVTYLGTDPSDGRMMQAAQYVDAAVEAAERGGK